MHDNSNLVLARVARFVRERVAPATYRERRPLTVRAWAAPGEPVPFAEARRPGVRAVRARSAVGAAVGHGLVPRHRVGAGRLDRPATRPELVVDLGFTGRPPGFQAEGLAYAPGRDGARPASSRAPPASRCRAAPGSTVDLYVEAAANPDMGGGWEFRPTPLGDLATAGDGAALPAGARRPGRARPARSGSCCRTLDAGGLIARAAGRPAAAGEIAARAGAGAGRGRPGRRRRHRGARAAPSWPACWPRRRTPSAHRVTRSGTRTSTRPGCGRCARPCARWPAPSPTCRR